MTSNQEEKINVKLTQRIKIGKTTHYGNFYSARLRESVVRKHFNITRTIRHGEYYIYVKRTDTFLRIMDEIWKLFVHELDDETKGKK